MSSEDPGVKLEGKGKDSTGEIIVAIVFCLLCITAFIIFSTYPHYPKTFAGWILYFAIGIPAYIILELLGEKVRVGSGKSGSTKTFSFKRVLLSLALLLMAFAVITLIWTLVVSL